MQMRHNDLIYGRVTCYDTSARGATETIFTSTERREQLVEERVKGRGQNLGSVPGGPQSSALTNPSNPSGLLQDYRWRAVDLQEQSFK